MPQPKIPEDLLRLLYAAGLMASCYQPTFLFPKDGRKLPNCPEETDPWMTYLRMDPEQPGFHFGIVATGIGATLRESILTALHNRPGLLPAMARLGAAMDHLSEAINAR